VIWASNKQVQLFKCDVVRERETRECVCFKKDRREREIWIILHSCDLEQGVREFLGERWMMKRECLSDRLASLALAMPTK